eukprot:7190543-Prymnesium_polylepis.1
MVISAFFAAQTLLAANLTPALLVRHGPKAYDLAVEMVKTDAGVRAAFRVSAPSPRPAHVWSAPRARDQHLGTLLPGRGCFVGVREEYVPLVGPLIDELLDKFFHQGGKRHAQQWQSWLDAASGKDGATALRTKLKVLQVCASPQPAH